MWQYLTPRGVSQLADYLYSYLPPKSIVIIGAKDLSNDADKNLKKAGFKNINGEYNMFFKDKILQARYRDVKFLSPFLTNDFCFEKR